MTTALIIFGAIMIAPLYLIIYINLTIRKNEKITKTR